MSKKILIVDDERVLAETIGYNARREGYATVFAHDGQAALEVARRETPDMIILDLMLPRLDGFEVCRILRRETAVPILMLTAREATVDKVRALDLGADDYLTKPFDHLELLARLRALLRRVTKSAIADPDASFVLDDLTLNFATHEVRLKGEIIPLTATEYRLLEELVRHAGTALPHQLLLERVWGPEYVNDIHYIKVFIRRLRQKLGDDAEQPRYIQTVWGIGYRFVPPR